MTTEKKTLGGWSPEALVTEEVKKICIKEKTLIEKETGADFKGYIPLTFRSQIVAGENYLVKVYVGVNKCVHALIFQALPCNGGGLTVTRVQYPKTANDPLVPFEVKH
ncbi:hypothetical protein R3I93_002606 [Phoxinus phoxinus]|uniref:Cystatin domain-containing protein n=1 Tax=Phoxinus phoxinus TaxID=58324 RepID=A0AAN9DFI9_9TELE